jgi:sphingomyelin phosphodiesterase
MKYYFFINLSGAFYTLYLFPGLRVVSLNMNYCDSGNYWLLINSTDPLGQLEWLVDVLQGSENINEKVHILGHIHPSSCMLSWSTVYYNIVNRYEDTIVGQFFGHSHSDYFQVFYDLNNITRATNVLYIAPSVTTYSYLNPGYRIYTVDGAYDNSSYRVIDHESYYLNITEANFIGHPVWKFEYSAKVGMFLLKKYKKNTLL